MVHGERASEYDLRQATDAAVVASKPLATELADVIKHVVSEMQRAGSKLPDSADESSRELLDAAQDVYRDVVTQLDDVLTVLRAIETFNIVLFGRTGAGKSCLIEALSRGDGATISPGESDYTTEIRPLGWRSCRIHDTPGIRGWTSGFREDLEKRAHRAVAIADIVFLCFDTQSQQDGEFRQVAEWVTAYGKPAIAVLNCRHSRYWRVPVAVELRSARMQMSRPVREHADYIREQLEQIGLPGIPIVAVHSLRAFLAAATEPLAGKAAAQLEPQLRDQRAWYGAARLWQWSNVPALEGLIVEAIRDNANATDLRLGRLVRQVRGALTAASEQLKLRVQVPAEEMAEAFERDIERKLAVLGLGEAAAPVEGLPPDPFDQLRKDISALGEQRGNRPLDVPVRGSLALHAKNVISPKVSVLRAAAQRRADAAIDMAMDQRRVLSAEEFARRVFEQTAVDKAVHEIADELSARLDQRLQLTADDLAADLHRVVVRGQAGTLLRPAGSWVRGTGIVSGAAGGLIVISAAAAVPPIAVALIVMSVVLALGGGWMRKRAIAERDKALASARADAARAVNEAFADLRRQLSAQFLTELRTAAVNQVGATVGAALMHRGIADAAQSQRAIAWTARDGLDDREDPVEVLRAAARRCEEGTQLTGAQAARALWLGESWIDDPDGLTAAQDHPPPRPESGDQPSFWRQLEDQFRIAIARIRSTPAPGSSRDWLAEFARQAGDDPFFSTMVQELRALAADPRPRLVLAGDYSAGKSSLIKRLLVDAGQPVPLDLAIGGGPTTTAVHQYEWRGMLLVDTPGTQGASAEHGLIAQAAVTDAAAVLYLCTPQLLVGEQTPLRGVLVGDPACGVPDKRDWVLFVIHHSDDLRPYADHEHELYLQRCQRKEVELRQVLDRVSGAQRHDDAILFVASDPYTAVGQRSDLTCAAYDAYRAWDGVAELSKVLDHWRLKLLANGVDVSVLHGGLARLGRLAAQISDDIAQQRERLGQYERLGRAVRDAREEGAALLANRRHQLGQRLADRGDELLNLLLATDDRDERKVIRQKLERCDDDLLREHKETWRKDTQEEVEEWRHLTGATLQRRVVAAQLCDVTPSSQTPQMDLRNLTHDSDRALGSAFTRALGLGGRMIGKTVKAGKTVGTVAKAGRFARFSGWLTLATVPLEIGTLIRDIIRDHIVEQARPELVAKLNQVWTDWAGRIADRDPALRRLCQELAELDEISRDLEGDLTRARDHIAELEAKDQLCREYMDRARFLLQK